MITKYATTEKQKQNKKQVKQTQDKRNWTEKHLWVCIHTPYSTTQMKAITRKRVTYHIHDLYQAHRQKDSERLRVVCNRPFQAGIILQEVLQQGPLVWTLHRH